MFHWGAGNCRVAAGCHILWLACFSLFFNINHAMAASQGCQAARGGAFSLAAAANADHGNTLNLDFETGDTLTFTTTGNPFLTQITVNGNAVPVAGNSAQFVFTTTGTFTVIVYIASNATDPSTLSANCQATTGEKVDAIKTMTQAMRIADINQQRSMLQSIQNSFLRGGVVAQFIAQLEARYNQLLALGNNLRRSNSNLLAEQRKREALLSSLLAQQARERRKISQNEAWLAAQIAKLKQIKQKMLLDKIQERIDHFDKLIAANDAKRAPIEQEKRPIDAEIARLKKLRGGTGRFSAVNKVARSALKLKIGQSKILEKKLVLLDRQKTEFEINRQKFVEALNNGGNFEVLRRKTLDQISKLKGDLGFLQSDLDKSTALANQFRNAASSGNNGLPEENLRKLQQEAAKIFGPQVGGFSLRKKPAALGAARKLFKNIAKAIEATQTAKLGQMDRIRLKLANSEQFVRESSAISKSFETASVTAVTSIARIRVELENLNNNQPGLSKQIAKTRDLIASTNRSLEFNQPQLQSIDQEIAQIDSQLKTLRGRMGVNPGQVSGGITQNVANFVAGPTQHLFPYSSGQQDTPIPGNLSMFLDLNSANSRVNQDMRFFEAGDAISALDLLDSSSSLNPVFNIWASGDITKVNSDQVGADRDGDSYSLSTGIYYAPSPDFMIGALYRFRRATSISIAQASDVEVEGHGLGLHSTILITPTLSLSGHALYERSNTDTITGIASGTFATDQLTLTGTLQGSYTEGPWSLSPSLGIVYSHADQETYRDSLGVAVPGSISRNGQITFGPTISYRNWFEHEPIRFIEPSLSVTGVWNYLNGANTTLASGTIIEQDDVAAQISLGLNMQFSNNAQLSITAGYSGFGASQIETYSIGGKISFPLGGQ